MKTLTRRFVTYGILGAMGLGVMMMPSAAVASRKGRLNTARILTGIAGYELLRGHSGAGLILGAGAAYAWKREKDAKGHFYYRRVATGRHHYRLHRIARR